MDQEKTSVINHYHNQGGIYLQNCHMTNITFQTINPAPEAPASAPDTSASASDTTSDSDSDTPTVLPSCLTTPAAHDLLQRLVRAGLLDEAWQPVGLSIARRGVLASLLAQRLGIAQTWKTFGELWGMKGETLRKGAENGMEQKHTQDFLSRVKEAMK